MTEKQIEDLLRQALLSVAPDLEGQTIDPERPFRRQFEIDSMDLLNYVIAVGAATGVEIPEQDYAELESLRRGVAYLAARLAAAATGPAGAGTARRRPAP